MRYGVISDIHGNYQALQSVLEYLKQENIDRIINCGDIIGYGPQPNECVEAVRNCSNMYSVIGNHDWAVAGLEDTSKFTEYAEDSVKWTARETSNDNINYLASLDYKKGGKDFMFVHGSPRDPLDEYILNVSIASENFKKMVKPICFVGHTHSPCCFRRNNYGEVESIMFFPEKPIVIEDNFRYIINVGSVGQPRDGNPHSSVCIYDTPVEAGATVTIARIEYDIEETQKRIKSSGLPNFLATRLIKGI